MDNIDVTIMSKVREKEAYLRDLKRCLAADICPECGGDLKHRLPEVNDDIVRYNVKEQLKCESCKYIHNITREED